MGGKKNGKKYRRKDTCPFPVSRPVSLQYANTGFFAESAAGTGFQGVWALNSLYDPDVTNPGHQPLYYDQLFTVSGPYQRYRVESVTFDLEIINTSNAPILAGWYIQPGPVDLPSVSVFQEKPWGDSQLLGLPSASSGRYAWRIDISLPKALGVVPTRYRSDDVFAGTYNTNPSQIGYLVVMIYGIGVIATATVQAKLAMRGVAFGRVAISGS